MQFATSSSPHLRQTLRFSLISVLVGAWLIAPSVDAQTVAAEGYQPLRPINACLDPSRIRSFQLLDSDELLIDAGRRHYLIELAWGCPSLHTRPALQFHSRNPSGRICGDIGEEVFAAGTAAYGLERCRIARITAISKDQFEAEQRVPRGSVQGEGSLHAND